MLLLRTRPYENIRNVYNMSKVNDAQTDANYSCRLLELTNFQRVAWKALKNAKLSFRSIKTD